jgi:hypothetical protein
VYLNFGFWALALLPGGLVMRDIGVTLGDRKVDREENVVRDNDLTEEEQT